MPRYIDADALMTDLDQTIRVSAREENSAEMRGIRKVLDRIKAAPTLSLDDVRGVGKWIWHDNYGWDDSLECSCCAEEFFVYDGKFPGIDSFKFCPNCGAKMKGAEENHTMDEFMYGQEMGSHSDGSL